MEFRAPSVATTLNAEATEYFTKNLSDPQASQRVLDDLMNELGGAVESFPYWHPILTAVPPKGSMNHVLSLSESTIYTACDHTRNFVRGFITCPYSESEADKLMNAVNQVPELQAYRPQAPLYHDRAYPVVVEAIEIELEADGTIRSLDAIKWYLQQAVKAAEYGSVAETWWNIRYLILGRPHGARSSLFVNQHAGRHMRKILEALNNSGLYGPIYESSLDMLSKKKRDRINETLIRAAVTVWDKKSEKFNFELRGKTCNATMYDTWDDGFELSVRVEIGDHDLFAHGFYVAKDDRITYIDLEGKQAFAKIFL